jgi:hypothetical protein
MKVRFKKSILRRKDENFFVKQPNAENKQFPTYDFIAFLKIAMKKVKLSL